MRIVNVKDCGEQEVERLLRKAAFDEVELSPRIREANKKLFGADLTAAEVVAKIVGDVRREGDDAVRRYTKLIDGADFAPEDFVVGERAVEAARARLTEAMKEVKIQEKLREQAFENFLEEQKVAEAKEIDELVSYRYGQKGS